MTSTLSSIHMFTFLALKSVEMPTTGLAGMEAHLNTLVHTEARLNIVYSIVVIHIFPHTDGLAIL